MVVYNMRPTLKREGEKCLHKCDGPTMSVKILNPDYFIYINGAQIDSLVNFKTEVFIGKK